MEDAQKRKLKEAYRDAAIFYDDALGPSVEEAWPYLQRIHDTLLLADDSRAEAIEGLYQLMAGLIHPKTVGDWTLSLAALEFCMIRLRWPEGLALIERFQEEISELSISLDLKIIKAKVYSNLATDSETRRFSQLDSMWKERSPEWHERRKRIAGG